MMNSAAEVRSRLEAALQNRIPRALTPPERATPERMPTGIASVDALTGGVPLGCLTEICGASSSGRTSVLRASSWPRCSTTGASIASRSARCSPASASSLQTSSRGASRTQLASAGSTGVERADIRTTRVARAGGRRKQIGTDRSIRQGVRSRRERIPAHLRRDEEALHTVR